MAAWYLYGQFATFDSGDPYIWVRTRGFVVICLVIAVAHVIVLGIPAYLVLRWRNAVSWWSTLLCGFTLGVVPAGVFLWPLRYADLESSSTVNGVQTMVDGVPTAAGWLQYLGGVSFFGACGVVGAAAFLAVRRMGPKNSFKPNPLRGSA